MEICKAVQFTPFVAGVKYYSSFFETLTARPTGEGETVIGYSHTVMPEERSRYEGIKITKINAHNILVEDLCRIAHNVAKALPKTETCPHWLRAWTDWVYDVGCWVLDPDRNPVAKQFLDMDYELVPVSMSGLTPRGILRRKWDAQIHLDGIYGIIK